MKITVEGSPDEMAAWMQSMAGPRQPASNWTDPAPYEEQTSLPLDDGPLPGCDQCTRFGDDRKLCRRSNCAYSEVNQAAQHGEG